MKNYILLFICLAATGMSLAQPVEVVVVDDSKAGFENRSYLIVKSLKLLPGFNVIASQHGAFYAKVHAGATKPDAPSTGQNFVREEMVRKSGVLNETQVRTLPLQEKATTYQYTDGAGRPRQKIAVGASPSQQDVVLASYFDPFWRATRQYLPYAPPGSGAGAYRTQPFSEQASFYSDGNDKVIDDARPYSEVQLDNSPFSKVLQGTKAGQAWSAKPVLSSLKMNDAGTVRLWDVVNGLPVSNQTYPPSTLSINETQDEEGKIGRTYTDFLGRTIAKETQVPGGAWAQTYYVYNHYGNTLFIIPPQAATTLNPDQAFAARWYFMYEYDEYQRQIGAKAPGAEWTYTIYDTWDRPVLIQDANQRAKTPVAEWTFMKYDEFNRPVTSGVYKTNDTRAVLTATVANSTGRYEQRNSSAEGYSLSQSFPTTVGAADVLTLTYYDDYSYTSNSGWDAENNSFSFVSEPGFTGTVLTTVKEMVTGRKVKVLASQQWLNIVVYYDSRYRTLQTIGEHHLGKVERHTNEYDFTGNITSTLLVHNQLSSPAVNILKRFEYDATGRLLKVYHKVNSQPEVTLTSVTYNELGQLITKKLHSTNGSDWLQSVDYRYNILGSASQINNTPPAAGDAPDYFSMQFAYDNALGTGNTARYDGLISGMRWTNDLVAKDKVYNFSYDKGLLTNATYKVLNAANPQTNVFNEGNLTYDLNGNILTLNRSAGTSSASTVDQLVYSYGASGGNQLMRVTDQAANPAAFNDRNPSTDDYAYDVNGNLTKDLNQNITSIQYNLLDLPERVTFTDNSYIQYAYSAAGTRLSQAYYSSTSQLLTKTDYTGEFVYDDGQLQMILHSQGRLLTPAYENLVGNTATREANTLDDFTANGAVTLTREVAGGETYVKAVSNQSGGSPGIFPVGGTFNVKPGESYSFKVLGYQSSGANASLYVWGNNGDIVWPGAVLPSGAAAETWVTAAFTIPAGVTQIKLGVLWNSPAGGNTFYINRVALYKTDWEYQYFLKDHLNSARAVLQTSPHTFTYTATMEAENYGAEGSQFFNLNSAYEMAFSGANATPGGAMALKMNANYKVGPARTFKVFPGDVVDASVMAFYPSGGTYSKTPLASMASLVIAALTGSSPSMIDGVTNAYNTSTGANPALLLSPDQGGAKPSAFLNYILFDDTYTPIEAKSQPLGGANVLHAVVLPSISVKETGYLLVYLSYDSDTGGDVFFDDLKIAYTESPLIQVNSYYPFGLTAKSWVREGETANKYLFQGKELNSETGWHDFHARQYNASVGRWFVIDPSGQFASPYLSLFNNPVSTIDPDGKLAWFIPVIIGAVVGATAGGIIAHNNGQEWYKGAIVGAFIGAAAGLGASAAIGPAGGITGMTVSNTAMSTVQFTKAWGVASTIIQSANLNMAMTAMSGGDLTNVYKSGLVGAVSGAFTATGGFGLAKEGFLGKLAYQSIGTSSQSIGNNWAMGREPFSRVSVGVGPVNLTFGRGQTLFQWQNNIGNIAMNTFGLINTIGGGKVTWDWKNLSPIYKGGLMDKFNDPATTDAGFSPYVVTGNKNVGTLLKHEFHHLWQSRAMGDMFALNFALQGLVSMAMLGGNVSFTDYEGGSYDNSSFVSPGNYFEAIPYLYPWWK